MTILFQFFGWSPRGQGL